jgi:hypothetical protein
VLFSCLIGLAGCPSPSSSSAAGGSSPSVLGGSPSPTPSGCFTTAYVRPDHKPLAVTHAVLTSAQLPSPVIPDPDVDIDSARPPGDDPDVQQSWADNGIQNAGSVPKPQAGLPPTEANLLEESNGVVAKEDTTLLTDDLNDLASDQDYGEQICEALKYVSNLITLGTINPNDPTAVADAIESLTSSTDPYAPDNLASAISDAYDQFEQAFPQCSSGLDTIQWIIGQLQNLFCGNG